MALSPVHADTSSFSSSAADWWFAGLDQRPFTVGKVRWTMQVAGVHLNGFHTWIQIEFAEDPGSSLLLRLTPWAGLQDAINIVRAAMMRRTSSGIAGTDSPGYLGDCHHVVIRGLAASAQKLLVPYPA